MNIQTGELVERKKLASMPPEERAKFVEVKRDLTVKEKPDRQITLYSPCGCGSGKNFKFCCHKP